MIIRVFHDLSQSVGSSGALRPGSSTKMVILILNGNGLFDHLRIWHLEITFA